MQRQGSAYKTDSPIIGTGIEYKAARFRCCCFSKNSGVVEKVTANKIIIRKTDGTKDEYRL